MHSSLLQENKFITEFGQKVKIFNLFFDKQWIRNVRKFQQKILNLTVVGAPQSFQFFRQITRFLRNMRALAKFRYRILLYLITIIKL